MLKTSSLQTKDRHAQSVAQDPAWGESGDALISRLRDAGAVFHWEDNDDGACDGFLISTNRFTLVTLGTRIAGLAVQVRDR